MLDRASSIDMWREKNQLDATRCFIEPTIRSTCFGQYYAHLQELETIYMVTACGTKQYKGGDSNISREGVVRIILSCVGCADKACTVIRTVYRLLG
jgi:hypothetical protein